MQQRNALSAISTAITSWYTRIVSRAIKLNTINRRIRDTFFQALLKTVRRAIIQLYGVLRRSIMRTLRFSLLVRTKR